MDLAGAERARYARQLVLPGFSEVAQALIRSARVHVVGAGAVGGPALLYLSQAGVGTIYVDEGGDVAQEDAAAWLYPAEHVGEPRLFDAIDAVRKASAFVEVRAHATGVRPMAALVCATTTELARAAAERARLAGLPHVVALANGDGGEVVAIPSGAPCYRCASRPMTGAPARGGAPAMVGVLGALELILVVAGAVNHAGRRIELTSGLPDVRPTARIPGCDCVNVY
jgi:molybdopterin-synthase adenylyltransferase